MIKQVALLLIIIKSSIINGQDKIYLSAILEHVNDAKEVSVDEFFEMRMRNNRVDKMQGKRCEILRKNTAFIYFGYPVGYDSLRYVERLFKVNIDSISNRFPLYEEVEGYHVRSKVIEYIPRRKQKEYLLKSYAHNFSFRLEDSIIRVNYVYKETGDFFFRSKYQYEVLLDKNNLTLIGIKDIE